MEKMTRLFPGSFMDYRKIDEDMLEEYLSARETGLFQTILFNYDEWLAGGRLRISVKEDISNPMVYRGWMLKPDEYKLILPTLKKPRNPYISRKAVLK